MIPKTERYIVYAVIIAGFIYAFFFYNPGVSVQPEDKVTSVSVYDSSKHETKTTFSPSITVKPAELPDNIIQIMNDPEVIKALGGKLDVIAKVLEKYFETNVRESNSYTSDSLHLVHSIDTCTENDVVGKALTVQCFKPITTITVEKAPVYRNKFYLGASVEGGALGLSNIGPEVSFAPKGDVMLYRVGWNGYEALKGNPYNFEVAAAWKISLGKKKNNRTVNQ